MLKLFGATVGISVGLFLLLAAIIMWKIFKKPLGFIFKTILIVIALIIVASAIISSFWWILMGLLILIPAYLIVKVVFSKKKG